MSALPAWLEPLTDAEEQRAIDAWAIETAGVPSLELMERAGAGLAALVEERAPRGRVVVLCGRGNNGGDGLVAARLLRVRERDVDVLALGPVEELGGEVRTNLERLPGAPPRPFHADVLADASAVVDAMLGTGFSGAPRAPVLEAIAAVNALAERGDVAVIAADVPSGVDASSGEVNGEAVRAAATATFHAAKPGLWIAPGKSHAGSVRVIEIGIPPGAPPVPRVGLIGRRVLGEVPRRAAASTKFAAGALLVCGGSTGLTGAPCLAAESAMRAGAGYVTACVPASLNPVFEMRLLEVMSVPLADEGGTLAPGAVEPVLERAERVQALILGPGLGRADGALTFARELASRAPVPVLLDADGLNAHAGRLQSLAGREAPTVLTPHSGELGRLLEIPSEQVEHRRLAHVREAAARAGAVVVLKGDDTLVADPEGRVAVSRGGSPALATAGTGDVLSGVIGAFLAKGLDAFTAASAGVLVHAGAGRLAAGATGPEGVIASDVIAALPRALADRCGDSEATI